MKKFNLKITEDYIKTKKTLAFQDINLWTGPQLEAGFLEKREFQDIAALAVANDITGGVVSHSTGLLYDAKLGNDLLLEKSLRPPFYSGITVVPDFFYDAEHGRDYLKTLIAQGARLVRVFPKAGSYDLRPWIVSVMIKALCAFNLPLMVWQTQVTWDDLDTVCGAFPDLQVILEGNPQKILYHNRRFYPLLEKHENLKIETHNVIGFLAVEDIVNRFGSDRLVFGSYLPYWDPNASMMAVTHARISDADKAKIAHGNLTGLIDSVRVN